VVGLLGDLYLEHARQSGAFADIELPSANFWFANLEAPFTSARDESRQHREWASGGGFKMDPSLANEIRGLTAVSVANNHALDFGIDAYIECLSILDSCGIGHAGGGGDAAEARRPAVFVNEGRSVAFLAYTCLYQDGWSAEASRPGMATIKVHTSYEAPLRVFEQPGFPPIVHTHVDDRDAERVVREIQAARDLADLVIVSIHWGLSAGDRPVVEYQVNLGRAVIDAGADAVFGHHPHVLQPLIVHQNKPIFLSLGNIVFDYDKAWRGSNVTASVKLEFGENGLERAIIQPLQRDQSGNTVRCDPQGADLVVEKLFPDSLDSFDVTRTDSDIVVNFPSTSKRSQ